MHSSRSAEVGSDALSAIPVLPSNQTARRNALYSAHQQTLDVFWNPDGTFIKREQEGYASVESCGGFRGSLWHCLAYLAGDQRCVERANRIIEAQWKQTYCAFAPGAAIDVLYHYRDRLEPQVIAMLERYLMLTAPQTVTDDLKIHGYNDNHPFKATHVMIAGGEMLDQPHLVQQGLKRLRDAVEVYERNGFPCEYNSPNYTPVSLQPLASIVEMTKNEEARDLALRIERFFWQDLALHFDSRTGICTGPLSRCSTNDLDGIMGGSVCLLMHLWPERFGLDLINEVYTNGDRSEFFNRENKLGLAFYQAHPIWYARAEYHVTPELESAIFDKPAGALIRGTIESGVSARKWKDGDKKPAGAPDRHVLGPRHSLLTTYYGRSFSLGTSQYSWLDGSQSHGIYCTIAKNGVTNEKRHPADAAVYFARQFVDDACPYLEDGNTGLYFREGGEMRAVQHENAALVFYNPFPYKAELKDIRTGVFRPLFFNRPQEVYVDEIPVPSLNYANMEFGRIAINEGNVYVGIIPMMGPSLMDARRVRLQIQDYGQHLSILLSSCEGWGVNEFSYAELLEVRAGFAFEVHEADEFASFADFRKWLASAVVEDDYYAQMRTTTYRREGLKLSSCYSPFHSAFRHVSVNGAALAVPALSIKGLPDPGAGLALPQEAP